MAEINVESLLSLLRKELAALQSKEPAALLTPDEAARLLACSRKHLMRLVAANVIAAVEVGGLRRIPRSEVDRIARTPAPKRLPRRGRRQKVPIGSAAAAVAELRALRAKRR